MAGVVPVIRVIQESLAGARIERVHGIVNGTTNFILTEMARDGLTFEQALAEAQRLGYAEADPSEDVDGRMPPRRWRSSPGSRSTPRCTSIRCPTRGSSRSSPTTSSTPVSSGSG